MQTETAGAGPTVKPATLHKEAGQSSAEMDDFIYLISHDVRASVRALLELPQWIKEDLEEAGISTAGSVGSSIELMNRHTGRLDRMLVDLLSHSRVGRMQAVTPIVLSEALDDVLDHVKIPAGFTITRDFQCDTITLGDRDLPLLLTELISNGVKHHHEETGKIHISAVREGAHVVLTVRDDGPGIEAQYHDRVFSPMTTLRPRDEVEGSGMGLAKVQKITRCYGGSAKLVTPASGAGISVVVTLPMPPMA